MWLITGVAGFIGSNLLEDLIGLNQIVVGLDNFSTGTRRNMDDALSRCDQRQSARFTMIEGDIRDLECCRAAAKGVDYVLHHAALASVPLSIDDPVTTNAVNVDGFVNMLVAAAENGVQQVVYASSSAVYGDVADAPQVEDRIGRPLSPYAASKSANEGYAAAFQTAHRLRSVGLRYFNVFGERQDPAGAYAAVIPRWITTLLEGQHCQIFGDGKTTRDFVYIADVIQANLLAATAPDGATGHVYNIGCGDSVTLNNLFEMIRGALISTRPALVSAAPEYLSFRPGDVLHSFASIDKAQTMLHYLAGYTVKQGLATSVSWYEARALADKSSDVTKPDDPSSDTSTLTTKTSAHNPPRLRHTGP